MIVDYIDASALAAVILKEPNSRLIDRVLREASGPLLASDLCVTESSSAIAIAGRRKTLDETEVGALWDQLDVWVATFTERVPTESQDVQAANDIVRRIDLKLRGPDAIHIATAARLGARLITLDLRMANAARVLGVPCLNPAEAQADRKA